MNKPDMKKPDMRSKKDINGSARKHAEEKAPKIGRLYAAKRNCSDKHLRFLQGEITKASGLKPAIVMRVLQIEEEMFPVWDRDPDMEESTLTGIAEEISAVSGILERIVEEVLLVELAVFAELFDEEDGDEEEENGEDEGEYSENRDEDGGDGSSNKRWWSRYKGEEGKLPLPVFDILVRVSSIRTHVPKEQAWKILKAVQETVDELGYTAQFEKKGAKSDEKEN